MVLTAISGDLTMKVTEVINADYVVSKFEPHLITVKLQLRNGRTGEANVNVTGTPEVLEMLAAHLSNQATAGRMALLTGLSDEDGTFEDGEGW